MLLLEGQEACHSGYGGLPQRRKVLCDQHTEAEEGVNRDSESSRDSRVDGA